MIVNCAAIGRFYPQRLRPRFVSYCGSADVVSGAGNGLHIMRQTIAQDGVLGHGACTGIPSTIVARCVNRSWPTESKVDTKQRNPLSPHIA